LHDSGIEVDSAPSKGTTVSFHLPVAPSVAAANGNSLGLAQTHSLLS
jgi:hypothetical protein